MNVPEPRQWNDARGSSGNHIRPFQQVEGHVRDRAPERVEELARVAVSVHRLRPGVITDLHVVGEELEHPIRLV